MSTMCNMFRCTILYSIFRKNGAERFSALHIEINMPLKIGVGIVWQLTCDTCRINPGEKLSGEKRSSPIVELIVWPWLLFLTLAVEFHNILG